MSEKMTAFWQHYGKWFLIGLPLAAVVIYLAAGQAHRVYATLPITEAAPLSESKVTFDMDKNRAYTAEDGVVVIPAATRQGKTELISDPAQVWDNTASLSTADYTLPGDTELEDGSIGILSIPTLGLSAPVYETEAGGELESMTKGIAHFAVTSSWDGNIGLCSHNVAPAGAVAYFRDIHQLKKGDILSYRTTLGEREYKVSEVKEIPQDDWSALTRTEDNRLTLVTCITGKPTMRLLVQAIEG